MSSNTITISPQALRLALAADRMALAVERPLRRLQLALARAARRRRAAARIQEREQISQRLLAGVVQ